MSAPPPRKVPAIPTFICLGLIYPSVMCGTAVLLGKLVLRQRLWMLAMGIGMLIGVAAAVGVLRLWVGKLPTAWSEPS